MALQPGDQLGPYKIQALLGVGGMGEVYRGRDTRLGRDVALKVISPKLVGDPAHRRRFELEARAASALNHPSIVTVYDVGDTGGVSWIAMEWVEGRTLRQALSDGPLPLRDALSITRQIADGLAAAHAKGVVHRDLKPENVMLAADGRSKILDFGLARQTLVDTLEGSMSKADTLVDNTGHRLSDGFFLARGQSVTTSALVELDYGVTDRLSATLGIPYVFAKYTGAMPPPSRLPVDACGCWHSSFQDFSLTARYRLGDDPWAVTPLVRYERPSHDYPYVGEAVVGRNLQEVQVGVSAGVRLASFLPRATVQVGYTYAFVESPLQDISIDRSHGFVDLGYSLNRKLYVRVGGNGQRTHGGLRAGAGPGNPFLFPGDLNTPERFAQRDRLIRTNYLQVGGGLSYTTGPVDVFASISKYVWGRDAHNGQAYTAGATWYFDRSK